MNKQAQRFRQLVDWRAAAWAGLASGLFSLLVNSALTGIALGNPWLFVRMNAGILLGVGAVDSTAGFSAGIAVAGALVYLMFSLLFGALVAFIVHRWGIAVGILGGAGIGLALYVLAVYGLSALYPWFYELRNWMMLVSTVVYGAVAGGLYEAWEVEVFVPVEKEGGQ
ncbi:MAG: hypothetical protein EPO32_08980 [Anaerolineae bacterium]|nr:MAG: hypothetical protein EPO32_08980 [Anaerolineae bacterium]